MFKLNFNQSFFWSKLLHAFGEELERLELKLLEVLRSFTPALSDSLLEDWERMLGLPDECVPLSATVSQRQSVAQSRYAGNSFGLFSDAEGNVYQCGLSRQFYLDYAESFGSSITINELQDNSPFRVDTSRVDQVNSDIDGARLWSGRSLHRVEIEISSADPNKDILKCIFQNRIQPAHIEIIWTEV